MAATAIAARAARLDVITMSSMFSRSGRAAEAGVSPRGALHRQVIMGVGIGDAETVTDNVEERDHEVRVRRNPVEIGDVEARFVIARLEPAAERVVSENSAA